MSNTLPPQCTTPLINHRSPLFKDILFHEQRREAMSTYEALQVIADSPESTDNQGLAALTLDLIDALLEHIAEATEHQEETDRDFAILTQTLDNALEQWEETKDQLEVADDLLEHANSRIDALKQEVTSLTAFRPF